MKRIAIATAAALIMLPLAANAADEFGIANEKASRFEAKVVSLNCEITGNCPANCGNGKHQLGLLTDDGKLVPVVKNYDPFAGATDDLLPFCGKRIVADGLMINSPKMRMFMVQFKKLAKNGKWSRANQFSKNWSKANGGKKGGQWFRADARIKAELARDGILGIPGLAPPKE